MMKRKIGYTLLLFVVINAGCKKYSPKNDPVTYGASFVLDISADKAVYNPGDKVNFSINKPLAGNIKIRYRHLDQTLGEETLSGTSWSWNPPATDYAGYLVDLYEIVDGKEKIHASRGVDVSSDWGRFPRYGFLSKFGQLKGSEMERVIKNLARHHINGIQFQDWQYKHHLPLAGTPAAPMNTWIDIANRTNYLSTVKGYIAASHQYGIKTMFYNLAFGALSDAASDGVQESWYAFKDKNHSTKDKHPLPQPYFKSDIFLTDAGNTNWQSFIAAKNNDVYHVFDFDGYHIDQLGNRGSLYAYNGDPIDQAATFKPFIQAMKNAAPTKKLVMNAVNQYGQQGGIATAPVDFLYSEVWDPNEQFSNLTDIILNNDFYGNNSKRTVLAAYMNYNLADKAGYFNTPGVLLTDAVIFAFGGSHLELGEHMLGKEYFPNDNLQMKDELKSGILSYYDFMVAYENLLRDGGTFNAPAVSCINGKMTLNNWPPVKGQVSVVGKEYAQKQVLHFLNFINATTLNWRDTDGTQAKPPTVENAVLNFTTAKTVKRIWMASPDFNKGVAMPVTFSQTGNSVSFSLPQLQYWGMVVVDY